MTIAKISVYADALSGTLIAKHYDAGANAFGRFAVKFADSERDGLDDAWELRFFMDLDETGMGDFDNDGLSDTGEHALRFRRAGALFVNPGDDDSDARLNGLAGRITGALNAVAEEQVKGGES